MEDLEQQMNDWLRKVKRLNPTTQQKAAMTEAGVKVLEDNLESSTRSKHYQSGRKTDKVKHLADSVSHVDEVGGSKIVGYETAKVSGINHARIARLLNDGWKGHPGDKFHDTAIHESTPKAFIAEKEVYDRLTGGGK